MELTSDILLKGTAWNTASNNLSSIFKTRPHYMLYMLALAIGIMYDKRIEKPDETDSDTVKSIPRNVILGNDNGKLDFFFQAAILSTRTESFTEDERLELAFGEKGAFSKMAFLTSFANFGITKLVERIGTTDIETMENIKNFLVSSVEGSNFEIDSLPNEIFLEE